jgi:hypothetical protein
MMKRYRAFSEVGVRDLASYNAHAEKKKDEGMTKMPQIVVVIDELADLMLVAAKEVEESICRVAQMGRDAPDRGHPAALGRCDHRPDEGEYPLPDRFCRGFLSGIPDHFGQHRRGEVGGPG